MKKIIENLQKYNGAVIVILTFFIVIVGVLNFWQLKHEENIKYRAYVSMFELDVDVVDDGVAQIMTKIKNSGITPANSVSNNIYFLINGNKIDASVKHEKILLPGDFYMNLKQTDTINLDLIKKDNTSNNKYVVEVSYIDYTGDKHLVVGEYQSVIDVGGNYMLGVVGEKEVY